MIETTRKTGCSAVVRISLHLNQGSMRIAQLAPDFIILREPASHPPSSAEITLTVDGNVERWAVRLPEGIRPDHIRIPISKI